MMTIRTTTPGLPINARWVRPWVVIFAITWLTPGETRAQDVCDVIRLENAHARYDLGHFTETSALLEPCVPDGFEEKAFRLDAYRLMALSHIATDSLEEARLWVERIVDADAGYRSDANVDPPVFTEYVQSFQPNWYNWLWKGRQWYHWMGRGVIVGAAVAIPVLVKKNQQQPLPGPPGFP
jgi:hypothetical protein